MLGYLKDTFDRFVLAGIPQEVALDAVLLMGGYLSQDSVMSTVGKWLDNIFDITSVGRVFTIRSAMTGEKQFRVVIEEYNEVLPTLLFMLDEHLRMGMTLDILGARRKHEA